MRPDAMSARLKARRTPARGLSRSAGAAALTLCAAGLLTACGSQARIASNPPSPPAPAGSHTASTSSTSTTSTTSTTSVATSAGATATASTTTSYQPSGGASGPSEASSTRTEGSAPAFVEQETHGGALASAVAVVRARGYTPQDTSDYHYGQTLRVLIGTRDGSADGYGQQAFFFVDGKYIGTDASEPSATLKVVSQGDTEVTLAYALYKPGQPLCCATGGQADVRFVLDNGKLTAMDPIPPVESKTGPSRQ